MAAIRSMGILPDRVPALETDVVTVIILNTLWIWNDYLLPSLILQSPIMRTIPIATFAFFGQYTKQWDLALPALVLGICRSLFSSCSCRSILLRALPQGLLKGKVRGQGRCGRVRVQVAGGIKLRFRSLLLPRWPECIGARKPPSIKGERSAPPSHPDPFAPTSHRRRCKRKGVMPA